jgi:hypothetical protein
VIAIACLFTTLPATCQVTGADISKEEYEVISIALGMARNGSLCMEERVGTCSRCETRYAHLRHPPNACVAF